MKKLALNLGKLSIALITIFIIDIFILSTTQSNANSESSTVKDTRLLYENLELKIKYAEQQKRLDEIEKKMLLINNYDNSIYSQILGLEVDTFICNPDSSIDFEFMKFDSIFKSIDDRSKYATEFANAQLEKYMETFDMLKKNKNILNLYPSISPIKTIDLVEITSTYGWRTHPIFKTPEFHDGIDISTKGHAKVYATISGKVDAVVYSKFGYGNKIVIKNSQGFETLYAHLSESIYVKKGQIVKKGQLIATTGNTGLSTGEHLHYEVHKNGELKDPLSYFCSYLSDKTLAQK